MSASRSRLGVASSLSSVAHGARRRLQQFFDPVDGDAAEHDLERDAGDRDEQAGCRDERVLEQNRK